MRRRGFTAAELAIVLSILVIIVPVVYSLAHSWSNAQAQALWQLQVAEELRTVAEELQLTARQGRPLEGDLLHWQRGDCSIAYQLSSDGLLSREAGSTCGGNQALARHVASLTSEEGGVEVVFARSFQPGIEQRIPVFIPVEVQ